MIISMYASGIPFNGETIHERSLGGSESAAFYVARDLVRRGNEVTLFTESKEEGKWDGVTYCYVGDKTQEFPLGDRWHFYVENTPHDVCIVQRHPLAFVRRTQAKLCLYWAHDICVRRNDQAFMGGVWQTNRVMTVSQWFKDQMSSVWTVNPDIITPIHNGVDYSLFESILLKDNTERTQLGFGEFDHNPVTMIYCSRPERGLDNLVGEGMIMEKLLDKAPWVRLKVCGYEHPVPELQGFYDGLRARIDHLPNCEHVGALTKKELYEMMCRDADVWCYPTEFEEVSCITAMECMAAGMTILTTKSGALEETIGDYRNATLFSMKKGVPIDRFVDRIAAFNNVFRRQPREDFTWERATDEIENIIKDEFKLCVKNKDTLARHLLRNSDVIALRKLVGEDEDQEISPEVVSQLRYYTFDRSPQAFAEHYGQGTKEQYEKDTWKYEENFESHPRFRAVAGEIEDIPDGAVIVDYGCAHGHFTNYLARAFPHHRFIGFDVSESAIRKAEEWAAEHELTNVSFCVADWLSDDAQMRFIPDECDVLILGEVLEHVPDPKEFLEACVAIADPDKMIITTPFGPWEEMSYEKEHPWRYHLHHLEREDLRDLLGNDVNIVCMFVGYSKGDAIGWNISTLDTYQDMEFSEIDYARKFKQQAPRQTVSFCAIVKDGENTLRRLLSSVEPVADEVLIGVDKTTKDRTRKIVDDFDEDTIQKHRAPTLRVEYFDIDSPLETGFDAARNTVVDRAKGDWILWADADEELVSSENMFRYLRRNGWNGYGVPQHHFSVEPAQVLNTDFPCRLFRRDEDVRFVGVVHEHPEHVDRLNHGLGFAWVANDIHFAHQGYQTEEIRRRRFQRNLSLMARDRKQYPDRLLGKFLWIRDLALMCRFDLENTRGGVTPQMVERARLGLTLWEETLSQHSDHPQVRRMVSDHLQFYDTLSRVMGRGFEFKLKLASGLNGSTPQLSQVPELSAFFFNKKHLDLFLSVVIDREVEHYEDRYL